MAPRSDGLKYQYEAVVDPDLCIRCGICVGACPTATPFRTKGELIPGIDLPQLTVRNLRKQIGEVAESVSGNDRIMSFACSGSRQSAALKAGDEAPIEIECMGQLPPAFIDFILSRDYADGVYLAGCGDCDCKFRLGAEWTEQRIARKRDPYLRKRVDDWRIKVAWIDGSLGATDPVSQIGRFRQFLAEHSEKTVKI